ncbi:alpha/beta hydrolase [Ekhidna sp.]|uniref:alpha/beta hydrolase n=1 Tax=Ekhidna sp. TaxID=2608089 RepID=UPI003CCB7571
MKKALITITITAFVTTILVLTIFEIVAQMDQLEADELEEVHSEILNESRNLLIHLPTAYDPERTYPILYVLDGSSQDFTISRIAEMLSIAEVVPELIIVGIPNTDRNRDLTPHFILEDTDGEIYGQADQFLAFIEKEAIPFIESKYSTNGNRMLAGHSRAGLFSFYAYLEKPDLFDSYFCFSPAFWRDGSIIIDKAREIDINAKRPFIFMSLGTEENTKMKTAYNEMTLLLDSDSSYQNFVHAYIPGANHGNNLYYSTPLALKKWSQYLEKSKANE